MERHRIQVHQDGLRSKDVLLDERNYFTLPSTIDQKGKSWLELLCDVAVTALLEERMPLPPTNPCMAVMNHSFLHGSEQLCETPSFWSYICISLFFFSRHPFLKSTLLQQQHFFVASKVGRGTSVGTRRGLIALIGPFFPYRVI